MASASSLPASKHFELQRLEDGIYAAIHRLGGAATCNAGIIDLGGLCLVFDTFQTPQAAEDLFRAIHQLLGRDADIAIDSHWHGDHTWGNQVFAQSGRILASKKTYQLMQTLGKAEFEHDTPGAAQTLEYFQQQQLQAQDEVQRSDAELFVGVYKGITADLSRMAMRLPDITFSGRMSFHGSERSAELIAYDDCHTGSDAVLFLPEEGIIFMGDLFFNGNHPYLGDGDPANLIKTLREIKQLKADRYVPGHGRMGSAAEIDLLIEYVQGCIETVDELVKEGKANPETINAMLIPEKFRHWNLRFFYPANIQGLCARSPAG